MILDNFLVLHGSISAAGVVTGGAANGAGNVLSANTIDNGPLTIGGNQASDLGAGELLMVQVAVVTAPTVGTSVAFQMIQADDAALSVNVQVLGATDAIPIASLPAGAVVPLNVDRAAPYPSKRYVGARIVNVGTIATATYLISIVKNVQDVKNIYFKSGFLVS